MGIDRPSSKCDSEKYPYCVSNGCLLTGDTRIPQYMNPYICERGYIGDNALITSNMRQNITPIEKFPDNNICGYYGENYLLNLNNDNDGTQPNIGYYDASGTAPLSLVIIASQ